MKRTINDNQTLVRTHAPMFGYFCIGVACAIGSWGLYSMLPYLYMPTHTSVDDSESLKDSVYVMEESAPVHIRIPKINVDARFEAPLGIGKDSAIEVPKAFDMVGWYKYGPTPGEQGPAVVVGHVDSFNGPEVFFRLRHLSPGDRIEIDREDGSVALFMVTRIMQAEQDSFPTEEVYGDIDHAGLRLVTCSGNFDQGTFRYSHNLIVFARLIEGE